MAIFFIFLGTAKKISVPKLNAWHSKFELSLSKFEVAGRNSTPGNTRAGVLCHYDRLLRNRSERSGAKQNNGLSVNQGLSHAAGAPAPAAIPAVSI